MRTRGPPRRRTTSGSVGGMDDTQPSVVLEERRGSTALVTLNRPEARNAVNPAITDAMTTVLDSLAADGDVRAVVLTGAGEVFCAGMDLKAAAAGKAHGSSHPEHGFGSLTTRDFRKPMVAAVNGAALAGGFELVLACDLCVASSAARFGIPEVRRGLMAVAGGLIRLPRRIPRAVALELAMTGDAIDAERARELGLVNRVVDAGSVVDEALRLAERIAENAPLAVRTSRRIIRESADLDESAAWDLQAELAREVFTHDDAREGPRAFAEKRPPRWTSS